MRESEVVVNEENDTSNDDIEYALNEPSVEVTVPEAPSTDLALLETVFTPKTTPAIKVITPLPVLPHVVENMPFISDETEIKDMLKIILSHVTEIKQDIKQLKKQNTEMSQVLQKAEKNIACVIEDTNTIKETIERKKMAYESCKVSSITEQSTPSTFSPFLSPVAMSLETPNISEYLTALTTPTTPQTIMPTSFLSPLPPSSILSMPDFQTPQKVNPGGYLELLQQDVPPTTSAPLKKRRSNKAIALIKTEMSNKYSEAELANGSVNGGKRKFKDAINNKASLSPARLAAITAKARRAHKDDFDQIRDFNEVINSKCRAVSHKFRKAGTDI